MVQYNKTLQLERVSGCQRSPSFQLLKPLILYVNIEVYCSPRERPRRVVSRASFSNAHCEPVKGAEQAHWGPLLKNTLE